MKVEGKISKPKDMKCNSCWCAGKGNMYLTTCSHIFCEKCAKENFSKELKCPACNYVLSKEEVRQIDLDAQQEVISSLVGYSPEIISESANQAMSFYDYQKKLEIRYLNHLRDDQKMQISTIQKECNNQLQMEKGKIVEIERKLGDMQQKLSVKDRELNFLNEKLGEKERENQKISELYKRLKTQYDLKCRESIKLQGSMSAPKVHSGSKSHALFESLNMQKNRLTPGARRQSPARSKSPFLEKGMNRRFSGNPTKTPGFLKSNIGSKFQFGRLKNSPLLRGNRFVKVNNPFLHSKPKRKSPSSLLFTPKLNNFGN